MTILIVALLPSALLAEGDRYVKQHALPDGRVAVVAEGDMEPRSIGSYSVRLYREGNPQFPTDDFQGGIICKRDGSIVRVEMTDIDGDTVSEVVVVIQCAGSGGYLSADAISVRHDKPFVVTNVADLGKNTDVMTALHKKYHAQIEQDKSSAGDNPHR